MSEFLERVQATSAVGGHDRTLAAVRGVFYALLRRADDGRTRELADHLPEELEALWKPALFACLRESDPDGRGAEDPSFVERVRRRAPELDEEGVEEVARAVLRELRPRLAPDARSELAGALPDRMEDGWTA